MSGQLQEFENFSLVETIPTLVEENTRQEIFYPIIAKLPEWEGMVVEVGVFRGGNLLRIAQQTKSEGKHVTFYGVDDFSYSNISGEAMQGVPEGDHHQTFKNNVKKCGLSEYITTIKSDSINAAKGEYFADGSVDLVYLDGSHTREYVLSEIRAWLPKVKVGGVIAGHDYPDQEVRWAVHEVFDQGIVKQTTCGSSWWVQL